MFHATARLLRQVLRLLLPAEGRHRATTAALLPPAPVPPVRTLRVSGLRGEDIALVRPYLIAHERREGVRRQRRRALVLATAGVDLPEMTR